MPAQQKIRLRAANLWGRVSSHLNTHIELPEIDTLLCSQLACSLLSNKHVITH